MSNHLQTLLSANDPTPRIYTVQQAFGLPSQMKIPGFAPGYPLVPEKSPAFVWQPALVKDLIEWLLDPSPDPLWITGPTGCGKTELLVQLGATLNLPTVVVSAKKSTEPDDILGRIRLHNGSTVFEPGVLLRAYAKGYFILFDEIDGYPPDVMLACHRILEKKPVVLDSGEIIQPAARVLLAATANTRGDGEGGEIYTATSIFNLATLNRFEKWVMDYYPPEIETRIIQTALPELNEQAITCMVKSAKDIRIAFEQGSCPGPISTRDLIRWGRKLLLSAQRTDVKPLYHAFDKAFGNGLNKHVRAALHKILQSHFSVPAP